jgi:hypothetical protein
MGDESDFRHDSIHLILGPMCWDASGIDARFATSRRNTVRVCDDKMLINERIFVAL